MAKIGFSGGEEIKKPGTGAGAGGNSGSTGGPAGAGSSSGNAGGSSVSGGFTNNKTGFDTDLKDKVHGASPNKTPSNEERAETSIAELRNEYAKTLQDKYNYNAERLKEERDAALRENWILQQQAEAALPEQMAAAGLSGGAAETSLADLRAQYQGERNEIRGNYMDNLGDLGQEHLVENAKNAQSYDEKWLEYLLNLAQTEAAAKYNR